jgi:poly(hydroxyalkanoate) granule-associated protein
MTMFDLVRNILLAGLGAQEKIKESIDELVKKGELSESQGAKIIKEWTEKANRSSSELRENMSEIIARTLEKMNLPSRDDIENLEKKIENLASRIAAIEKAEKKEP